MADTRQGGGLHIIFAIFLGLMVTALVGVGVYTIYPPPTTQRQIQDLSRREQAVRNSKPDAELTADDRAQMQALADQRNALMDSSNASNETWGRTTSIILIAFATLSMAVSLVRADQLPVISNGLLLGGVFTMLYGVGCIITTGTSVARLGVMTVAFVITVGLGYLRFVRGRAAAQPAGSPAAAGAGLSDLERRVKDLEERLSAASSALGPTEKR